MWPNIVGSSRHYRMRIYPFCCIVLCDLMRSFITGLPLDTNEEEFIEMMSKYGIIMQDPDTSKDKKIVYCNNVQFLLFT